MLHEIRTMLLTAGMLLASAAGAELVAQGSPRAPTPACALLSVDDIRKITGHEGYSDTVSGDGIGEGVGGGSSCQYDSAAFGASAGPPMVGVVLIPAKDWTRRRQSVKLREGCRREPVSGVGDVAFFESCPSSARVRRTAPLYVKVGANDLIVEMDVQGTTTEADARMTVIAVAKAAAARAR